jgi:hypothetical protein
MGEDEEIRKFLKEDPHFEPIPPGGTDNFAIQVPVPMLPAFTKVLLYSDQTRGVDKERIGAR